MAKSSGSESVTGHSIKIQIPSQKNHTSLLLEGRDARKQILVDVIDDTGAFRDVTGEVQFQVLDPTILILDADGWAKPLKNGSKP